MEKQNSYNVYQELEVLKQCADILKTLDPYDPRLEFRGATRNDAFRQFTDTAKKALNIVNKIIEDQAERLGVDQLADPNLFNNE